MFDLMGFFITNFDVKVIYEAGWKAAQAWTTVVSGSILALAIIIRTIQEQLAGAKGDFLKAFQDFIFYAFLTSIFFFFVYLIIEFFNAIYGTLNASSAVSQMGKSLNKVFEYWSKTKFEFSLTDLANGFYGGFAFAVFILTYMVLVFVVFAMRIAHAILVSSTAFWAAVAIPMATVNGLKSLQSLKTLVLVAFLWPIFDAFFMYLVSTVFTTGLERAFDTGADTVTAGQMVFVLFVYSIINLFMVAACMAAPFVAQGIANGTGNITGLLGSFGAAGIAAGAIAAKYGADKVNAMGDKAGAGLRGGANALGGALNEQAGLTPSPRGNSQFNGEIGAGAPKPEMPEQGAKPEAAGSDTTPEAGSEANLTAQEDAGGNSGGSAEDTIRSEIQNQPSGASNPTVAHEGVSASTKPEASNLTGGTEGATASNKSGSSASSSSAEGVAEQASAASESQSKPQPTQASNEAAAQAASGGAQNSPSPEAKAGAGSGAGAGAAVGSQAMNFDAKNTQVGEELAAQADTPSADDENLASDQAKKEKQARRGAIINQNRGKK